MLAHQVAFAELLIRYGVLRFGEFVLKSGKRSPYFFDAGRLRTGLAMRGVGEAYAAALASAGVQYDLVFGPAYKGIPLAVATASAASVGGRDVPFCFDRKEEKDHGEGGWFVGTRPEDGMRAVIVDDVVTSGISVRQATEQLRAAAKLEIAAVVVAVDRRERQDNGRSAVENLSEAIGCPIHAVLEIRSLLAHLRGIRIDGARVLDDELHAKAMEYVEAQCC